MHRIPRMLLSIYQSVYHNSAQQKFYFAVISLICLNLLLWNVSWSFSDSVQVRVSKASSKQRVMSAPALAAQAAKRREVYSRLANACLQNRATIVSIGKAALNATNRRCPDLLERAIPAVSCEIFTSFSSNFESFESLARFNGACETKSFRYSCNSLDESPLRCAPGGIHIPVYNYHKQHHCLSEIADKLNENIDDRVPRILHYVWFYKEAESLELLHYLGLISTIHFFRPKAIFIWYDYSLPSGRWWAELLKQFHPVEPKLNSETVNASYDGVFMSRTVEYFRSTKIYAVYRKRPTHIYNNAIKLDAHRSDIVRIEALLHYGGLYIDTDVLTVQSIDQYLQYSVVFPKEPTPSLSNSIIFAERQALYLYLWHHTYTTFKTNEWCEHSTTGNFELSKVCPHFLRTESDSLMKPTTAELFLKSTRLPTKRMFHLYWGWKGQELSAEKYRELRSPVELLDWQCTIGSILKAIFLGTCDISCE